MKGRYLEIQRALILILAANIAVALSKLFFGLLANSLSMVANGIHSVFDSVSNIIGLVGVRISSKPPDKSHPYGHAKYETFATIGIAVLLILTSVEILGDSIERIINPTLPDITFMSFAVMIGAIVVNVWVTWYERRRGVELQSPILVADSNHTKSDIYASLAVIVGFVVINAGHPVFDPIIALLIAGLIAHTAYSIIKESSAALCDMSTLDDHVILKIVQSISGINSCHRIRTRGTANQIYVDLHILVPASMSVKEAHDLSEVVERKLKSEVPGVRDVVVHVEPSPK